MGGIIDAGYGVADARREKLIKRGVLVALALALICTVGYFSLRTWSQERAVGHFLDLLKSQQYAQAYDMWDCKESKPCKFYPPEKFAEDFGAASAKPRRERRASLRIVSSQRAARAFSSSSAPIRRSSVSLVRFISARSDRISPIKSMSSCISRAAPGFSRALRTHGKSCIMSESPLWGIFCQISSVMNGHIGESNSRMIPRVS